MLFLSLKRLPLCICILSQTLAVPTLDFQLDQQKLALQNDHDTGSPRTSTSLLAKLSSGLIERIWPQYRPSSAHKSHQSHTKCTKPHLSRYDGDSVLRFTVNTEEEALAFAEAVDTLYIDVWETSKNWADIRISKKVLPSFLTLLPSSMHHAYTPIIPHLSQAVFESSPGTDIQYYGGHRPGKDHPHDLFFHDYRPLSVLYPWLRVIASSFRDHTQLFTIGTSYEGRDIPAISIGRNIGDEDEPRRTILITAGSHAREWISTSTAAFIIRSLVQGFDSKTAGLVDKFLDHYDVIIIPVLNPDGYEYSWTTDRLWRKNRQDTILPFCRGIDLDRSFPFSWDGDLQIDNPCSESYAGEHPLQAIEAQRLHSWAKNVTESQNRVIAAFIDLHSYSQEILYPYSYTCDRRPKNLEDLEEVASGLAKAFRLANGYRYRVDSACEGSIGSTTHVSQPELQVNTVRTKIEESGGSVLDFFYQDLGVRYAFQIKLRDTGSHGFLLPRSHIVPTGVEAFNALLGLGKWMLGNRGIEGYTGLTASDIWGEDDSMNDVSPDLGVLNDDNGVDEEEENWYRRRRR